mmetsp:Transcript_6364/g.11737  ORF Transcript_6364/g.11737 Transcript_6364/m.11737 type:complete len:299 (-) Transcript_6364:80-976(-)
MTTIHSEALIRLSISGHLKDSMRNEDGSQYIAIKHRGLNFLKLDQFDEEFVIDVDADGVSLDRKLEFEVGDPRGKGSAGLLFYEIMGSVEKQEIQLKSANGDIRAVMILHEVETKDAMHHFHKKIDDKKKSVILSMKSKKELMATTIGLSKEDMDSKLPRLLAKINKKKEKSLVAGFGKKWLLLDHFSLYYASKKEELDGDGFLGLTHKDLGSMREKNQKRRTKDGVVAIHVATIKNMRVSSSKFGITLEVGEGDHFFNNREYTFEPIKNKKGFYKKWSQAIVKHQEKMKSVVVSTSE